MRLLVFFLVVAHLLAATAFAEQPFQLEAIRADGRLGQLAFDVAENVLSLGGFNQSSDALTESWHYYHRQATDSGRFETALMHWQPTSGGLAGVMIRPSLQPNSASVFLGVNDSGEIVLIQRAAPGAPTVVKRVGTAKFPLGLRLEQKGAVLNASLQLGAMSVWTPVPPVALLEGTWRYEGVALTSNSLSKRALASFRWLGFPAPAGSIVPVKKEPLRQTLTAGQSFGFGGDGRAVPISEREAARLNEATGDRIEQELKRLLDVPAPASPGAPQAPSTPGAPRIRYNNE